MIQSYLKPAIRARAGYFTDSHVSVSLFNASCERTHLLAWRRWSVRITYYLSLGVNPHD